MEAAIQRQQHNYNFIAFSLDVLFYRQGDSWKEATSLKAHYGNFYTIKVYFSP